MNPPTIPERFSSLLPEARKEKLASLLKRKVSSTSQVSVTSTIADFIDAKTEALESDFMYSDTQRLYLTDALKDKTLTQGQFDDLAKDLPSQQHLDNVQTELKVLKKHRKLVEDDLQEIEPEKMHLESAYISLMITRVEAATTKAPKMGSKVNRTDFRNLVFLKYAGRRYNEEAEQEEHFCCITGWYGAISEKKVSPVRAAHIVPRSLSGEDLEYLFGVSSGGSDIVSSAENGNLSLK